MLPTLLLSFQSTIVHALASVIAIHGRFLWYVPLMGPAWRLWQPFLTYLGSTKEIQGTHHCVIPQAQDTPCPAYLLFATLGVFPEWCSHYTGFFIHKGEALWEVELLHLRQRKANAV